MGQVLFKQQGLRNNDAFSDRRAGPRGLLPDHESRHRGDLPRDTSPSTATKRTLRSNCGINTSLPVEVTTVSTPGQASISATISGGQRADYAVGRNRGRGDIDIRLQGLIEPLHNRMAKRADHDGDADDHGHGRHQGGDGNRRAAQRAIDISWRHAAQHAKQAGRLAAQSDASDTAVSGGVIRPHPPARRTSRRR